MDKARSMKTGRGLSWVAAVVAGSALLAAGAGLAQDTHQHAAPGAHDHVAHAAHHHDAATEAKSGDYQRSVKTYSVPDVTLVDSNGKSVRLRSLLAANEPVMMNFIFTTCTAICPVMTSIFSKVPKELGAGADKLRMISISIDPENDTPPQLKAYASKFDAGPRWQFLTGTVENVATVQRAFETYRSDKMEHEPLTLMRPAPGKPWVRIDGFASPEDLAKEYQKVASK
jgi:protein SCO1/2